MPGGHKNIKGSDNTNGFQKNPQNIHKGGRPKKIYNVVKEMGYSVDDMRTAFGEVSWYDMKDLKKAASDESKPIIVRIVAKMFISSYGKSDFSKVKDILEQVLGKPQSSVDVKTGGERIKQVFTIGGKEIEI